jgi:hypothetical protein
MALTNMIEAEFSEKEAITVIAHKTHHFFDRYHNVSSGRESSAGSWEYT